MSFRLFFSFCLFFLSYSFLLSAIPPFKQVTLFSDRQEIDQAGILVCAGNVFVEVDDRLQIRSPYFIFDYLLKKGEFCSASEQIVSGQMKDISWTAETASFDIDQKEVKIKNIHAKQGQLYFSAQDAQWEPEKAFFFKEASFTSCKNKDPHWQLLSHRLYLSQDQKIRSSGAFFKMGYLKIPLPISLFSFSLKSESGFFIPRFYWDRIGGFGVKQNYSYQSNPSFDQTIGMHWLENKGMILSDQIRSGRLADRFLVDLFIGYGVLWQPSSFEFPIDQSWHSLGQLLGFASYDLSSSYFDAEIILSATQQGRGIGKKSMQWIFEKKQFVDDFRDFKAEFQMKKKNHSFSVFSDYRSFKSMKRTGADLQKGDLDRSVFEYGRLLHAQCRSEYSFFKNRLLLENFLFTDLVASSLKRSTWKNQQLYYQKKENDPQISYFDVRFLYQFNATFRLYDDPQTPFFIVQPSFFIGQKYSATTRLSRRIPSVTLKAEVPLPSVLLNLSSGAAQSKFSLIWECTRSIKAADQFYGNDRYDQFFDLDFFGLKQQVLFFYKESLISLSSLWGIDLTDEVKRSPLKRGVKEGFLFPFSFQFDLSKQSLGLSLKAEGAIEQGEIIGYQIVPFCWGKWERINVTLGYVFQSSELARRRLLFELGSAFFCDLKLIPTSGLELSYHLSLQPFLKTKGFINKTFQCLWKFDCWHCGVRFEQERSPFLERMIDEWKIGFDLRFIFY